MKNEHLVLVGLDFQNKRSSGDKNFWVEVLPLLTSILRRITVFSVRDNIIPTEQHYFGKGLVDIRYIKPAFLETGEKKGSGIFWRKGAFPAHLGIVEKFLDVGKICNELKKLYREDPYGQIHLMDNFGFSNRLITEYAPAPVSVSAMAYQGKGVIYDAYLRISYSVKKLKVIPYSMAYAKKMVEIGIRNDNLHCIRWGVKLPDRMPDIDTKNGAKRQLGFSHKKPLFIWAGYIQQIGKKDFFYALNAAKNAITKDINCNFLFAFKPECFENNFAKMGNPAGDIHIRKTSNEEFSVVKQAADVLYSPIVNKKCVVAPPLTWLEFLSLGVPILTTDAGGAEEVVQNGKTGYVALSEEDLLEKAFKIKREYKNMTYQCQAIVTDQYNIENSAKEYLKLWSEEL